MAFFNLIMLEERIVLDAAAAAVLYVDAHNTSPVHDGTSWAHAYTNVQDALTQAGSTPAAEQIWIAKGTYTPGTSTSSTFNLPNNVSLYGGFKGTERSLSQRNPTLNPTILSGDVLGNDLANPLNPADPNYDSQLANPSPAYQAYLASKADNTLHVLTATNGVTATLDGLTIIDGFANGSSPTNNQGGGLLELSGANITINNDIFRDNASSFEGGAVHADGIGTTLTVTNSLFNHNQEISPIFDAQHGGAAISIVNGASASISHTLFMNNQSGEDGGAIRLGSGSVDISYSQFLGDQARRAGGALTSIDAFNPLQTTINIDHTLFQSNSGSSFGGAIFAVNIDSNTNSLVHITNSQFVNNTGLAGGAINATDRNVLVENTKFIGNTALGGGGAIYDSSAFNALFGIPVISTMTVKNSDFINNNVTALDPAIWNGFWSFIGSFFFGTTDVIQPQGGGAIVNGANLTVTGSQFVNNTVQGVGDGGAIIDGGGIVAYPAFGFAIAYWGNASIDQSSFVNNSTQQNGGAIAELSQVPLNTPLAPTLQLTNSSLVSNNAANGGALYMDTVTATITGNTFSKSNDATNLADQIWATNSLVNGLSTSTSEQAVISSLISSNSIVKLLIQDDLYIA